jgi:hypothetical protein
MHHLSFGRKREAGLGTRIPAFELLFETWGNLFSIIRRVRWPAFPDPGGAVADNDEPADTVRSPAAAFPAATCIVDLFHA